MSLRTSVSAACLGFTLCVCVLIKLTCRADPRPSVRPSGIRYLCVKCTQALTQGNRIVIWGSFLPPAPPVLFQQAHPAAAPRRARPPATCSSRAEPGEVPQRRALKARDGARGRSEGREASRKPPAWPRVPTRPGSPWRSALSTEARPDWAGAAPTVRRPRGSREKKGGAAAEERLRPSLRTSTARRP